MKWLSILIKLRKNEIESLQKSLTVQEQHYKQFNQRLFELIGEAKYEIDNYQVQYAYTLAAFLEENKKNQQKCDIQIRRIKQEIDHIRTKIYQKFSDLKKLEIIMQNRSYVKCKEISDAEGKVLDEITANKYRKQKV